MTFQQARLQIKTARDYVEQCQKRLNIALKHNTLDVALYQDNLDRALNGLQLLRATKLSDLV